MPFHMQFPGVSLEEKQLKITVKWMCQRTARWIGGRAVWETALKRVSEEPVPRNSSYELRSSYALTASVPTQNESSPCPQSSKCKKQPLHEHDWEVSLLQVFHVKSLSLNVVCREPAVGKGSCLSGDICRLPHGHPLNLPSLLLPCLSVFASHSGNAETVAGFSTEEKRQ
ncbi:hypothetical protein Y1Q_0005762 [Alligator mississippiensis]|uniref:C3H1-type domain-containing protein n=1 Tax=Alligator mississippiensis TaxID=8496 RepID=A0A151MG70_ALLMI|nr:hypothetical protein Y1Q_0005762 [Alligator mississippiensis]